MTIYRQGDILLVSTDHKKPSTKPVASKRVVLAEGEVTGHHHIAEGAVAEFSVDDKRMLWVEAPAPLNHPEHATIEIAPGAYWIVRQREYSPAEIRRVAD